MNHAKQVTELVNQIADDLSQETDLLASMKEAAAVIEALRAGMGTIAEKRRMAVRGLHASGMTYKRIAEQVGISQWGVISIDRGKN